MARIIWSPKYDTGIDLIDRQHRSLCFMFNKINQAMEEGGAEKVANIAIPQMLKYAKYHFATEEKFMEEAGYEKLSDHIESHGVFKKKVGELQANFEKSKEQEASSVSHAVQVVSFLWEWFVDHIQGTDMEYVSILKPIEKQNDFRNADIIEQVASHEEEISRLYSVYGEYLPNKDFWVDLAAEEVMHAYMVRNMIDFVKDADIHFNEKRFKTEALELSRKHIQEKLNLAKEQKTELKNALGISLDIERSLLEKRCFEIFEGDSIKLKHGLEKMNKDIALHIKRVEQELQMVIEKEKEEEGSK